MSPLQDVRFVLRTLGRRPGMVAAIVLTLALGIGANTAVFTLVDAIVLHPVAAADAKHLIAVYTSNQETPYAGNSFAFYKTLAQRSQTLAGVSAYTTRPLDLGEGDRTEEVNTALVTENYFAMLGARAQVGRTLVSGDTAASAVAVLSNALWRGQFGGDSAIIGKRIALRGQPMTVVGVMPATFRGTDLTNIPDVWVPVSFAPTLNLPLLVMNGQLNPRMALFSIVGRLAPGVDRTRAEAEAAVLAQQTDAVTPSIGFSRTAAPRVSIVSLNESAAAVRDRASLFLFLRVLVGVVVLTLVLACLNIANLLIVRARERAREMGIRIALGANARHLVRQLLTESLILAIAGGIAGVAVAYVSVHALWAFTLPGRISLERVQPDISIRVLLFSCGLSLLTALVFGLLPAARATRMSVIDVIRDRPGSGSLSRRHLGLIAIQAAISLVLLVDSGLLVRTIRSGLNSEIGFDARMVAALSMAPKFDGRYAETVHDYHAIISALETKPGIQSAAIATHVPVRPILKSPFAAGPVPAPGATEPTVTTGISYISDNYFDVLNVPIVQGRRFGNQDVPADVGSVILNESAARALWPNESPIGKVVHAPWFNNAMPRPHIVVGVVRDTKYGALNEVGVPFAYFRMTQLEPPGLAFTVLTRSTHPRAALPVMEQTVGEVSRILKVARRGSSAIPVRRVVADQVLTLLAPQRFGATLLTGFALLALCVSAVGIYGIVASAVARRTTEIGIRMALGASARNVLSIVLIDTGAAIAVGTIVGVIAAGISSSLLRRLLFGVGPFDSVAFGVALLVMAAMACAAALIPSWRAVSIDPVRAIRTSE